jgi:hypothetical protein
LDATAKPTQQQALQPSTTHSSVTSLTNNMILLHLVIDPLGRFGPTLQHILFDIQPTSPFTIMPVKPDATSMYSKRMRFSSPKGVLNLTNHN